MLYNKTNLLIHNVCTDTQPKISGVLFKKDKTVATDSFVLIEVDNSKMELNPDDYPQIGEKVITNNFPNKGFVIPANAAKKAISNLAECKNGALPILSNAILAQTGQADEIKICSTNLEKTDIIKTKLNDGDFPNYQQIIPNLDKASKISININKLKQLSTLLSQMDLKFDNKVDIYFNGENSPMVLKAVNNSKQQITALLMPIHN